MNIGTLTIEMLAKLTGLEQGMNQAKRVVTGAMGDIRNSVNMVNNVLGLIGVSLSATAVVAFANKVIGTLADLNDMAQKTGSSVENLSRMQQISVEFGHDFNLMDTSLSRLAKGMSQFDSVTNYTSRALRALGVESRDAAGNLRDPSQVMVDIAKRLQAYGDGAGKAALVTDLFGKSGAELLPILNDMADNIDRYRGMSAEAAAEADRFQNLIGNLSRTADQLSQSLVSNLVPALSDILKSMSDAYRQGGLLKGVLAGFGSLTKNMFDTDRLLPPDQKIVARLQEIQGSMDGILERRKAWYMPSNYADGELQSLNAEALALQKELVLLQDVSKQKAAPKPQLNYLGGTEGPAAAVSAYERASKAAADYIQRLKEETENIGLNTVQIKLMAAAREAAKAPLASQSMAIMTEAQAWATATDAQEASVAAAQALAAEEKKRLDGYAALVSADEKSLASLVEKNNLLQYGAEAVAAMDKAELQAALDRAWAADKVDPAVIAMLERRLELSQEIADETKRGVSLQAAQDAAKAADAEWARVGQSIEQTGRLAFVQFAAHGVSAMQSIGQAIKLSIFDAIYQLTVRKWIINIVASVGAATGSSGANAGLFSNQSLSSGTSGLGNMLGSLGSLFGEGGSVFGAGVGTAGASAGTAFIGGAGTALGGSGLSGAAGGMAGLGGLMSGAAAALPVVGAWLLAGSLASSFGAGKKIFGIKGDSFLTTLFPIIGVLAGLFGKGPKQYGPQLLNGTFSDTGFQGNFQADWTRKVGLFGGKKHGTTDFPISPDQVNSLNNTVTAITASMDAFIKSTGDADRSLAGWTYTVRQQIQTQEQQDQLTLDLTNSIGAKLIPEVVALQQKNEALADAMTRLSSEYTVTASAIDLTGQSFGATGLASLAARDDLVQLLGGLQTATSALQPYFENFYTDAERVASTTRLMNAQFAALGITTIPETNAQFRALVEAQDLSTEAGRCSHR